MRRFWIVLLAGCASAPPASKDPGPVKIDPKPAPDFVLLDTEGREICRDDLKGRVAIVNFWAAWCAACDGDLRILSRVQEKHPEIVVIGISYQSGAATQVAEFGKRLGTNLPLLVGTREAIDAWGVGTYPTTFVLDPEGRIRYCVFNSRTEEFWEELLASLR